MYYPVAIISSWTAAISQRLLTDQLTQSRRRPLRLNSNAPEEHFHFTFHSNYSTFERQQQQQPQRAPFLSLNNCCFSSHLQQSSLFYIWPTVVVSLLYNTYSCFILPIIVVGISFIYNIHYPIYFNNNCCSSTLQQLFLFYFNNNCCFSNLQQSFLLFPYTNATIGIFALFLFLHLQHSFPFLFFNNFDYFSLLQ